MNAPIEHNINTSIQKYVILDEVGLIIEYYQGVLTLDATKKSMLKIINDPKFNSDFVFIIDIRNSIINITKEELDALGLWVFDNLKLTGLARLAVLTSNTEQVVTSMIFSINENFTDRDYETFSTLSSAIRWLNINSSYHEYINKTIDELQE